MVRWFLNSTFIVTLATAGTLFSASLVAYSFARFDYRGRNTLFFITLATMMMPAQVTLIPQFVLFFKLGLDQHAQAALDSLLVWRRRLRHLSHAPVLHVAAQGSG